ncbi:glycosyl hydrolase family 61-domain-containing protein [Desarmillaria ectypa]|nr:glycosyl hydrolase family 61-domain-containing protein [Desarmillaria ectypa]
MVILAQIELYVDGVSAGHLEGIRVPDYDDPITDVISDDIICNGGINPYHMPISTTIVTVPSGSTVTAEWLDGVNSADSSDPIDSSHKGPVMSYLAKVNNATQTDVASSVWFKIYEDGHDASSSTWAVDTSITTRARFLSRSPIVSSCVNTSFVTN